MEEAKKMLRFKQRKASMLPEMKALLETIISYLDELKAKHQVELSSSKETIIRQLQKGRNHRAISLVESMIGKKSMMKALVQVEGYCSLLVDEATSLDEQKKCPEELVEAVAGVLFASRKLQEEVKGFKEIRSIFESRYGREFVSSTSKRCLHVNAQLVERLSSPQMTEETKVAAIRNIASDVGIEINLDDLLQIAREEKMKHESRPSLDQAKNSNTDQSDSTADYDMKQNIDRTDMYCLPLTSERSIELSKRYQEEEREDVQQTPLHRSISSSSLSSANALSVSACGSPSHQAALVSRKDKQTPSSKLWNPVGRKLKNAYQFVNAIPKNLSAQERKLSVFRNFSNGVKRVASKNSAVMSLDCQSTVTVEDEDLSEVMAIKEIYKDAATAAEEALRLANLAAAAARAAVLLSKYDSRNIADSYSCPHCKVRREEGEGIDGDQTGTGEIAHDLEDADNENKSNLEANGGDTTATTYISMRNGVADDCSGVGWSPGGGEPLYSRTNGGGFRRSKQVEASSSSDDEEEHIEKSRRGSDNFRPAILANESEEMNGTPFIRNPILRQSVRTRLGRYGNV